VQGVAQVHCLLPPRQRHAVEDQRRRV
jgi:hypothetical protein